MREEPVLHESFTSLSKEGLPNPSLYAFQNTPDHPNDRFCTIVPGTPQSYYSTVLYMATTSTNLPVLKGTTVIALSLAIDYDSVI